MQLVGVVALGAPLLVVVVFVMRRIMPFAVRLLWLPVARHCWPGLRLCWRPIVMYVLLVPGQVLVPVHVCYLRRRELVSFFMHFSLALFGIRLSMDSMELV